MQVKNFQRTQSGALVSTDKGGLEAYRQNRENVRSKERKIQMLEERINTMEDKIDLILQIVRGKD